MDTVTEKSTSYLSVAFKDQNGAPAVPASATYTVHDEATGTLIRASTPITPIASSVVLTLTVSDNTLVSSANKTEIRKVTVLSLYGGSEALNEEFRYELVNLQGIS